MKHNLLCGLVSFDWYRLSQLLSNAEKYLRGITDVCTSTGGDMQFLSSFEEAAGVINLFNEDDTAIFFGSDRNI